MKRYFFHVSAEDATVTDLIGIELPDAEAVRDYADLQKAELWSERVLAGKPPPIGWLGVVDEEDRAVLRMPL